MPEIEYPKSYEALGRFVEAFEGMVHETRSISTRLLSKDPTHLHLIEVALHHPSITAKPVFEILRAIIIQIVDASIEAQEIFKKAGKRHPMTRYGVGKIPIDFSPSDREIFLGVLKTIADEFMALVNMRNNLLHGAWLVGYTDSSDPFAEEFHVHKYAVTKEGLSALKLPKSRGELLELGKRCNDVTRWLWQIDGCINGHDPISERFQRRGSDWVLAAGQTTLPKK